MDDLIRDLKYAGRTLLRSPGFTAVAVLTLALGIGATTALFSVVRGVILRPLPYPEPDELVRVQEVSPKGWTMNAAWPNFVDFRKGSRSFETLVAYTGGVNTVLGTERPLRVPVAGVTEGFLEMMGARPRLGRGFLPEDHRQGAAPVVLVSHDFWKTHLGSDPDLSDDLLSVSSFQAQVVGVLPPGFDYPRNADVWYSLELLDHPESRTAHSYRMVGRLRKGVTPEAAREDLARIAGAFTADAEYSDWLPVDARVQPLHEAVVGPVKTPLLILLGASLLVLLVACTNLASTFLARGTSRAPELAVRSSLGAERARIVRQLFTESVLLSAVGAAGGVVLAWGLVRGLPAFAPSTLPRLDAVTLDVPVLLFAVGATGLTAVLFGLLPALRISRGNVGTLLRTGSRGNAAGDRRGIWRTLVVAEVALALVLLVGSGLLMKSFAEVLGVDPGFDPEGVLTVRVTPPASKYPDGADRREYLRRLVDRLQRVPGAGEAAYTSNPPMGGVANGQVQVRGGPEENVIGNYILVSPGYFEALGIRRVRGRTFEERDHAEAPHVVVVSESFAEMAWPGKNPVGKAMTGGGMDSFWEQDRWAIVIGVVEDVRQRELTDEPDPTYYFPLAQRPSRTWSGVVAMRFGERDPAAATNEVRAAVREVDPDVPASLSTMEERMGSTLADRRFTMFVLGVFAGLALLLAAVGIYGVVSYTVARRTREIGIRVALGAAPGGVLRMVLGEAMATVGVGTVVGLVGAVAATRLLRGLLYEVNPTDPVTIAGMVVVLGGVAWVASWIPARRVTRVDPMRTMRTE